MIAAADLALFAFADDPEEGWETMRQQDRDRRNSTISPS
jgi:hypothetical protein